jgi:hypothetical protein
MPNFSAWRGTEGQPDAIAAIIARKSSTTGTIARGSSTVSAKTGRLETLSGSRQVQGQGGITYQCDAMLLCEFGTGFKPGDRFSISSVAYEVVIILPGHTDCEQVMLQVRR